MSSVIGPKQKRNRAARSAKASETKMEEDHGGSKSIALKGTETGSIGSHAEEDTAAATSDDAAEKKGGGYSGKYSKGGPAESKQSFLYSLHTILSTPDALTSSSSTRYDDVVTWLPHGKGFIICDKGKFEKEILPTFLPNTKYASFGRRLKRWKFVRVSSGVELGAYYNPHFQRGKPQLIKLVSTDAQIQHDARTTQMPFGSFGMPQMAQHQALFAGMRHPYSDFGSSGHGASTGGSSFAASQHRTSIGSDSDAQADVRDFPSIMKQISKKNRRESLKSKRQSSGMGHYNPPYSSDASMGMMPQMMPGGGFYPSSQYPSSYPSYWDAMYGNPYSSMMMQGSTMAWNPSMAAAAGMSSSSFNTSGVARQSSSPPSPHMPYASTTTAAASGSAAAAAQTSFDRIYRQQQQKMAAMYGGGNAAINDPSLSSLAQDWMMMKQLQQQRHQDSGAIKGSKTVGEEEESAKDSDEGEED